MPAPDTDPGPPPARAQAGAGRPGVRCLDIDTDGENVMAYKDIAVRRQRDRERFHKRTAERIARSLCPRCGDGPPASGRGVCDPCGAKRNKASRARDARLRAEGKPRRDPDRMRSYERKRSRREIAARSAEGLCTRCGKADAVPDRASCKSCLEKRRAADRARYARGKAAGLPYGGANADAKRRSGRDKSRRRQKARRDAGLCIRCGQHPPAGGGTTCTPCRDRRQAAERQQYAERKAAGLCTRCGGPAFDGLARCGPCAAIDEAGRSPERKNARSRQIYAERRARSQCTACGAPSQGAARCAPCAEKSYHGSAYFRGIPVWDPSWTVIELETGRDHGSLIPGSQRQLERDFSAIRDLRDPLAHASLYAETPQAALELCSAVRRILDIRQSLADAIVKT